MDNITVAQINTMPKQDVAALNRKLSKQIAINMVGLVFVKLTMRSVLTVLARKALIEAAKHA